MRTIENERMRCERAAQKQREQSTKIWRDSCSSTHTRHSVRSNTRAYAHTQAASWRNERTSMYGQMVCACVSGGALKEDRLLRVQCTLWWLNTHYNNTQTITFTKRTPPDGNELKTNTSARHHTHTHTDQNGNDNDQEQSRPMEENRASFFSQCRSKAPRGRGEPSLVRLGNTRARTSHRSKKKEKKKPWKEEVAEKQMQRQNERKTETEMQKKNMKRKMARQNKLL